MGCGILFPRDYNCDADSDGMHDLSPDNVSDDGVDYLELEDLGSSDSEDEEWWGKPNAENGTKVQVRVRLHWRESESKSDIAPHRESDLMFTLNSDKGQRKNSLSLSV